MMPHSPISAKAPLLIGRVRSADQDDSVAGGDIVIMREARDGSERIKIFQRDQQSGATRFFYRLYDSLRGNINCTALIESRNEASVSAGKQLQDNPQLNLQNALKSIRKQATQSTRACDDITPLREELAKLNILSDEDLQSAELSEEPWNVEKLFNELKVNFFSTTPADASRLRFITSWEWLAQCRDDTNRIFTGPEITRAKALHGDLIAKASSSSPQQAHVLREVDRLIRSMSDRAADQNEIFPFQKLYRSILKADSSFSATTFNLQFQPLIQALNNPDQPVRLVMRDTSEPLCNNLARLHAYWDVLQKAPDIKIGLMPVIFKVEQAFADHIKIFGVDQTVNGGLLKPEALRYMADDIRQCIADNRSQRTKD